MLVSEVEVREVQEPKEARQEPKKKETLVAGMCVPKATTDSPSISESEAVPDAHLKFLHKRCHCLRKPRRP